MAQLYPVFRPNSTAIVKGLIMASLDKVKKILHGKRANANRGRKPAKGKPLSDFKRIKLKKLFGK